MSVSRAGQGRKIQVDLRVDDEPIATIVFGKESGHPFFRDDTSDRASTSVQVVGVYAQCLCIAAGLYTEEHFLGVLEFVDQLVEELREGEGVPEDGYADDQDSVGDIPF